MAAKKGENPGRQSLHCNIEKARIGGMRKTSKIWKTLTLAGGGGVLVAGLICGPISDRAASAGEPTLVKPNPEAQAQAKQLEFAVFTKHCTQCHNSVADPERPGKTRDEWYAIVNLMQGHGLDIAQEEADMIVDLLFNLRRGMEQTPG
jgi:hypothetical protein